MTDVRAKAIEAVARGMFTARYGNLENCWAWDDGGLDIEHPHVRETYLRDAAAAIDALLSALPGLGLAAVPQTATEDMITAGWIDKEDVDPGEIWQAMGAAAPSPLASDAGR